MGGRACVRDMRMPGSVVMGQIAHGVTMEEVLRDYPDLEHKDIAQALAYTAWLAHEKGPLWEAISPPGARLLPDQTPHAGGVYP